MDYELYPIPLSDINRPVYYMLKSFLEHKIGSIPPDMLEEEWTKLKVDATFGHHLLFPSEDFSQPYDSDTLKREVIIIRNCSITRQYVNGELQEKPYEWDDEYDDEEDLKVETQYEPHEEHFYIDIDPDTGKYRLVKKSDTFVFNPTPFFHYNAEQLIQSIDNLLSVVKRARLTTGNWEQRLNTTRLMVGARVNELHILHNGGLFDYNLLGCLLDNSSLYKQQWLPRFNEYVSQLKVFAMFAANLSWSNQGNIELLDKAAVIPPFIAESMKKERQRRQNLQSGEQQVPHSRAGEVKDFTPLEQPEPTITENPVDYKEEQQLDSIIDKVFPQRYHPHDDSGNRKKEMTLTQEEKNRKIMMLVCWYVVGMLVLAGIIMMAKYWLTGTVTISVGVISAMIMRHVQRLKEGYESENKHPKWFIPTLVFSAMMVTLVGFWGCKKLSEYLFTVSNGMITPWLLFAIVAAIMAVVFFSSRMLRKGKTGKAYRLYTVLIVFSCCLTVSQCVGSLTHSDHLQNEEWIETDIIIDDSQDPEEGGIPADTIK